MEKAKEYATAHGYDDSQASNFFFFFQFLLYLSNCIAAAEK